MSFAKWRPFGLGPNMLLRPPCSDNGKDIITWIIAIWRVNYLHDSSKLLIHPYIDICYSMLMKRDPEFHNVTSPRIVPFSL